MVGPESCSSPENDDKEDEQLCSMEKFVIANLKNIRLLRPPHGIKGKIMSRIIKNKKNGSLTNDLD